MKLMIGMMHQTTNAGKSYVTCINAAKKLSPYEDTMDTTDTLGGDTTATIDLNVTTIGEVADQPWRNYQHARLRQVIKVNVVDLWKVTP